VALLLVLGCLAQAQTRVDLSRQTRGAIPEPLTVEFLFAGVAQNGNAGWYFSAGTSNAPSVTAVSQTAPYAGLVFGPCSVCDGSDDVTGFLWLPRIPERWPLADPSITMRFRTVQTSQAFTVEAVAECAGAGSAGDPATFGNAAGTFALTSPASANQWFDDSVAELDLSGCDPGDGLWIRVQRTDNNAGDLQVIWAALALEVTQ
jgi:hypothetical protein